MSFQVPSSLESRVDELLTRYPERRSASLMVLHALQEHFGHISRDATLWIARKLGLAPINIHELVTFYPMFRQAPAGRNVFKVCRTLSCAMAGSHDLHAHLCGRLGLDPKDHALQTTPDGRCSVEFVECIAGCGTAPVMMCNEEFHEAVTSSRADELLGGCR